MHSQIKIESKSTAAVKKTFDLDGEQLANSHLRLSIKRAHTKIYPHRPRPSTGLAEPIDESSRGNLAGIQACDDGRDECGGG